MATIGKNSAMMKRVIFGVFVALIAAIALLSYLSNYSSPPPAPPTVSKAQEVDVEHRLLSAIKHPIPVAPAASGSPVHEVSVTFAQDDVNTMLATNTNVKNQMTVAGIEAARITFMPSDRVRLDAWTNYQGTKRQLQVEGVVSPNGTGGIKFRTDSAKLGLLPLPPSITAAQIDDKAGKLITHSAASLPLTVEAVTVTAGRLTLSGPKR
jgi:hypothetical protein